MRALQAVGNILLVATLAGVVARRRVQLAWSFAAYLLAVTVCDSLVWLQPERFYTRPFWILKQGLYDVLKVGIALELAVRVFGAHRGAAAAAKLVLGLILAAASAALVAHGIDPDYWGLTTLQPRIFAAAIWLMAATLCLATWFNLRIHPFQMAILAGYVPYLLAFSALLAMLDVDVARRPLVERLDVAAYTLLLAFWCYAAWRPDCVPGGVA